MYFTDLKENWFINIFHRAFRLPGPRWAKKVGLTILDYDLKKYVHRWAAS